MSSVVFFSKINLTSHIFDVYKSPVKLREIQNKILLGFEDGLNYLREDTRYLEEYEEEVSCYKANYKLGGILKLGPEYNNAIVGQMYKTSDITIKEEVQGSDELRARKVENTEVIRFYYDIYKEVIAFYTSNRFGQNEFNKAFREILNKMLSSEEEKYDFEVDLYKEPLKIEEIKQELQKLDDIEELVIHIKTPNPNDELLNEIHQDEGEYLKKYKDSNTTSRSIIFRSTAARGLDTGAELVSKELDAIDEIHSGLSGEDAISKGYAKVEATTKNKERYSTQNQKPRTIRIKESDKAIGEFINIMFKKITKWF